MAKRTESEDQPQTDATSTSDQTAVDGGAKGVASPLGEPPTAASTASVTPNVDWYRRDAWLLEVAVTLLLGKEPDPFLDYPHPATAINRMLLHCPALREAHKTGMVDASGESDRYFEIFSAVQNAIACSTLPAMEVGVDLTALGLPGLDGHECDRHWLVKRLDFLDWAAKNGLPIPTKMQHNGPAVQGAELKDWTGLDKHNRAILRCLRNGRLLLVELCSALPPKAPQSRKAVSNRVHQLETAKLVTWVPRMGISLTDRGRALLSRKRAPSTAP